MGNIFGIPFHFSIPNTLQGRQQCILKFEARSVCTHVSSAITPNHFYHCMHFSLFLKVDLLWEWCSNFQDTLLFFRDRHIVVKYLAYIVAKVPL